MVSILRFLSGINTQVYYFISSYVLYPLLHKVIRYRKKIVRKNLMNAFPGKTEEEIKDIEKKFYAYLSDLFVETLRSFSISKKELAQVVTFKNPEVVNEIFKNNKSAILTLGHKGNYEWMAQAFPFALEHQVGIAYKKVKNPTMEQLFKEARGKYGVDMFTTEETGSFLRKNHDRPFLLTLANDQSAHPEKCYWTKFLNQDTSFHVGTEKVARKMNLPVVFAHVSVPKRGHYEMSFELICLDPSTMPEGSIMEKHAKLLEADILAQPEYWLWSHKRWKHAMPAQYSYGFTNS